ncbi:MAG TPA: SDR family NAD(P)-dependent oxidoreductase [bacterium]|nr:SDR family NAD(P)-dependent oxidoreductase [bacterium]
MRIAVTGGAGFIGSHLVERLLALGHEVRCLENFDAYYDEALKRRNLGRALDSSRFRLVEGDIRDAAAMDPVLEGGSDAVVHLAARPGVRRSLEEPAAYAQINVVGTINVLEACRLHRVGRIVVASSSSVYGRSPDVPFREDESRLMPASPYGASKLAAEQFSRVFHELYGIPVTCLRFFTVYGPRQRPDMAIAKFVRCVSTGTPLPMYGDGSTRRDYTYVRDVVEGVVGAIERSAGYRVYNLGTEDTVSLRELIATIERAVGRRAVLEQHPDQPGDVPLTHASVARAARELGYAPRVGIEQGVRAYVAWLRGTAPAAVEA